MELISHSEKILQELNIEDIWNMGIHREPLRYHHTVMYPPLKTMHDIDEKEIFSNFKKIEVWIFRYISIFHSVAANVHFAITIRWKRKIANKSTDISLH
jgi:hypothetical protein